jgi:hypothetical protein
MSLELYVTQMNVDSTSHNVYGRTANDPFLVKNIGDNTVWVGHVSIINSAATVSTSVGFPLAPGESVVVPAYVTESAGADRICGFNTASGTSRVAIIDHSNE